MRLKYVPAGVLAGLFVACPFAQNAMAAPIVQYNFGSVGTIGETLATMTSPTSAAANVTTQSLTFGSTTLTATDEGASLNYYSSPAPNYLSVSNSSAADDSAAYIDFTVTANTGYTLTPTSFTIVGGRGGSSNVRSFLLFDNVDGLPTSIAATAGAPAVTGGSQVGSTTDFAALRGGGAAMDTFTLPFTAADQNLSSFEVRVYIDTQLSGQQKNIDLGSLTLNGTVDATPEPASLGMLALAGLAVAKRRRR